MKPRPALKEHLPSIENEHMRAMYEAKTNQCEDGIISEHIISPEQKFRMDACMQLHSALYTSTFAMT